MIGGNESKTDMEGGEDDDNNSVIEHQSYQQPVYEEQLPEFAP